MSNLDTFAKVRALHDRTENPGEKASAAGRMKALAKAAGMTVAEALSKLDTPAPISSAQAAASAFNDFFNTPEMRARRAEREFERLAKCRALLDEYGTESAVWADTEREAALRHACEPLLGQGETWNTIYRLDGWGSLDSPSRMPDSVRRAVTDAWPVPATVAEAWAEYAAADKQDGDRCTFCPDYSPHSWAEARRYVLEGLCNTLPARSLNDIRARLSWMEHLNGLEIASDPAEERVRLATLRADIERMGATVSRRVADAKPAEGATSEAYPARRTTAQKRADVMAMLGTGLTDREIARRAGVSPQTVGNIRRLQEA